MSIPDQERQPSAEAGAAARPDSFQQSLDRRMYYLNTLYALTAELSPITRSRELLERFLLMAMGAIGTSQGVVVACDRRSKTVLQISRGADSVSDSEPEWTLQTAERRLYLGFQTGERRRLAPMSVVFSEAPAEVFPASEAGLEVHTAILFMVDDALLGLIGLGAPVQARALSAEERDLLRGLTANFMVFLKNVRAFETVQALNADLTRTNAELRQTITELTAARQQIRVLEVAKTRLKQLVAREIERMGRFRLADAGLILVSAFLLALLFNLSNPNGIPLVPEGALGPPAPRLDAAEARQILDRGEAVLVDARPQELHRLRHIPDAVSIPAPLFDIIFPMKLDAKLQPGRTVIVYGGTISRNYDEEVAARLLQRHDNVKILAGGLAAWEKQGYPVAP